MVSTIIRSIGLITVVVLLTIMFFVGPKFTITDLDPFQCIEVTKENINAE